MSEEGKLSSNSECPTPESTRPGFFFVWLDLVNTVILDFPWTNRGIIALIGTCFNLNS